MMLSLGWALRFWLFSAPRCFGCRKGWLGGGEEGGSLPPPRTLLFSLFSFAGSTFCNTWSAALPKSTHIGHLGGAVHTRATCPDTPHQ